MKIIVNDISCSVEDPMVLPIVRELCRAKPNGYRFMRRYKSGRWDGYVSLMTSFRSFPTGLLKLVKECLEGRDYKVELEDHRKFLVSRSVTPDCLSGVILRDYQIEAANVLISKTRGVAKMATNAGKTEVMAAMLWGLDFPQSLILVHRKELMYQTAERFAERLGVRIGIIGDGKFDKRDITVAMIQTISNKFCAKDWIDNQVIMVDECHHMSSNQLMNFLVKIQGSYRYGFSGTPLKRENLSDMKLVSATSDIEYDISNKFLITEGYSAVPIVHIYTVGSKSKDNWKMEYQPAYDEFIVNSSERNKIIAKVAKESVGVTLILVNRIQHGEIITSLVPGSVMIDGSDSTDVRRAVLDMMRLENTSGVFISSPILDEGVNVPEMNAVILAGGGKSHIKLLQRIGRGMRKKGGDNVLHVYDFVDRANKHLFSHSEERIGTYIDEGFNQLFVN
jgi:superfamily II DNA or RNA helicase